MSQGYLIVSVDETPMLPLDTELKLVYRKYYHTYLFFELKGGCDEWKTIEKTRKYKEYYMWVNDRCTMNYIDELPTHVVMMSREPSWQSEIFERQAMGEPSFASDGSWLVFTRDLNFVEEDNYGKLFETVFNPTVVADKLKQIKMRCRQLKNIIKFDTDKVTCDFHRGDIIIGSFQFIRACTLEWKNEYASGYHSILPGPDLDDMRDGLKIRQDGSIYLIPENNKSTGSTMYIDNILVTTMLKQTADNAVLDHLSLKKSLGRDIAKMISQLYYWQNVYA